MGIIMALIDLDAMDHLFRQVFRHRIVQRDQALFMQHHDGGCRKKLGNTSNIEGSSCSHGYLAILIGDAGCVAPGEGAIPLVTHKAAFRMGLPCPTVALKAESNCWRIFPDLGLVNCLPARRIPAATTTTSTMNSLPQLNLMKRKLR